MKKKVMALAVVVLGFQTPVYAESVVRIICHETPNPPLSPTYTGYNDTLIIETDTSLLSAAEVDFNLSPRVPATLTIYRAHYEGTDTPFSENVIRDAEFDGNLAAEQWSDELIDQGQVAFGPVAGTARFIGNNFEFISSFSETDVVEFGVSLAHRDTGALHIKSRNIRTSGYECPSLIEVYVDPSETD